MIHRTKEVLQKLEIGILEILVGLLMFFGLVGYFYYVPADVQWLDHTISFVLFSYLFYRLNISSMLFGHSNKKVNLAIISAFFIMFFKDYIAFTLEITITKFKVLRFIEGFYVFLFDNINLLNFLTVYIGIIILIITCIYLTRKIEISHPSFLYAVTKNYAKNKKVLKFILIFASLLGFYFFIYNTVLEWLEFTLDDPVIAVGIVFFIAKIVKHRERFHKEDFIFKIGDFSERLYSRFVSMFHYKHTLPLGIAGLLILHALTDAGVFAYSYATGKSNIYLEKIYQNLKYEDAFEERGGEFYIKHYEKPKSFLDLYSNDKKKIAKNSFYLSALAVAYIFNTLSLIFFLFIPVTAWAKLFLQKNFHLGRGILSLIYASIAAYLLKPSYIIQSIKSNLLFGVNIKTLSVLDTNSLLNYFTKEKELQILLAALIALLMGVAIYFTSRKKEVRTELYAVSLVIGMAFYGAYIFNYFRSSAWYLINGIKEFIISPHILIALVFLIILALSILFYIGGYLMFIYEIIMEYHNKKWSEPIDEELVKVIKKINKGVKELKKVS